MGERHETGIRDFRIRDAANLVRLISSLIGIVVLLSSIVVAYHSVEKHEERLVKLEEWRNRHSLRSARCIEKINALLALKGLDRCIDDGEDR